ncbi:hypothetical protein T10_863 [Trichinella papuae]|uniref:Uncharacterized protein n=1 Tax=Trichinella papuae TaxID=268474 RepID=A0A0V1N0W7_9BILA|nr:hypothetical protein T10_863 [Trichinella papuae]
MLCTSFEETSACTRSGQGKDSGALPWGLYKGKQRQVMAPPGNVEATEGQSDSGGPREQSFRGSAAARQKLDQRSERTATERHTGNEQPISASLSCQLDFPALASPTNASDRHRVATIELVGLEEKHTAY